MLCGPLKGPEVYSKIRQIRETGFTSRARLFKKSYLLTSNFKILKTVGEP
jgi:hypothetical protein